MTEYKRRLKLLADKFTSFNIDKDISQFPIEKLARSPLDDNQIIRELEKHCGVFEVVDMNSKEETMKTLKYLRRYNKVFKELLSQSKKACDNEMINFITNLHTEEKNYLWTLICMEFPDDILYVEMKRNSHPSKSRYSNV